MSISSKRNRRKSVFLAIPIATIIAALLLMRGCETDPPPVAEALFVPSDLSRLRQLDRDGIINYCRQLKAAKYNGVLRGAHGALWAGEANAWDRVLLAVAAMEGAGIEARIVPSDPPRAVYFDKKRWHAVRFDENAPVEESEQLPAGAVEFGALAAHHGDRFHTIEPMLVLEGDDGIVRVTAAKPERIAEWASMPVMLKATGASNEVRYTLRVGERTVLETGFLTKCNRAWLEMTWRFENCSQVWTRELFDRENGKPEIPGHDAPRAGDCYAIVLAAGPLAPEVLATRTRMLELPKYTPVAEKADREILGFGVKYLVDSDERAVALAKVCNVAVSWHALRLTIVASEVSPIEKGDPDLSMDTLADAVEASGKCSREFHIARGLANDLIESRVIFEARRLPVVSASTVFSNFKANSPDAPARRIALLEAEANRLLAHELVGATVTLEALASSDDPAVTFLKSPALAIERTKEGVALRGLSEGVAEPDRPWTKYHWAESTSVEFGNRVAELARVADALLCRHTRRADFLLQCTCKSAWPLDSLPVVAGSFLDYSVNDGKKEQRLGVRIGLNDGVATNGKDALASGWPKVALAGKPSALLASSELLAKGEAVKLKVRVGETEREVTGRKIMIEGNALVTLLDCPTFPLVLTWEQGKSSLRLASASPVVQGRILDRDTGAPALASVKMGGIAKPRTVRKPLDLRAFKPQGPDGGGKWMLADDGLSATQTSSQSVSFFVSPEDVSETTVRGTIEVTDAYVRNPIGFVLGYCSPIAEKGHKGTNFECLLFNWQPSAASGYAAEGFTLARVNGNFLKEPISYPPFDDMKKRPGFEVLATLNAKTTGWVPKFEYHFEATYRKDSVRISIDDREIFNVKGTFTPGRFGFYNFGQANVRYRMLSRYEERVETAAEMGDTLPVAADGSYALSAAPPTPRVILILDGSTSMDWSLDPRAENGSPRPAPGQSRFDHMKKAVHGMIDRMPPGVEVALWSFWTESPLERNMANPAHTREY